MSRQLRLSAEVSPLFSAANSEQTFVARPKTDSSSHVRITTPQKTVVEVRESTRRSSLKGGGMTTISSAAAGESLESDRRVSISTPKLNRCESEICVPHPLRRSSSYGSKWDIQPPEVAVTRTQHTTAFSKIALRNVVNNFQARRGISLEDAKTSTSPVPDLFHRIGTLESANRNSGGQIGDSWQSSGSSRALSPGRRLRFPSDQFLGSQPLTRWYLEPPKTHELYRLSSLSQHSNEVSASVFGAWNWRLSGQLCTGCHLTRIPWYSMLWDFSTNYCHYTRQIFCSDCLENTSIIPHRVIHYWDFRRYRVCRRAHDFLEAAQSEQWIDLRRIHPAIKKAHPAIIDSWHLRHDLMVLKRFYITSQRAAQKLELNPDCIETFCMHILEYLAPHMPSLGWLSDNTAMFSISDLQLIEQTAAKGRSLSVTPGNFCWNGCCRSDTGDSSKGEVTEFFSRLRLVLIFWKNHLRTDVCEDCALQFDEFCQAQHDYPLLF